MKTSVLGRLVALALGASAIASCSEAVRLAPDFATPASASAGTREVCVAANADALLKLKTKRDKNQRRLTMVPIRHAKACAGRKEKKKCLKKNNYQIARMVAAILEIINTVLNLL
jgi:hypothetical protein